VFLSLLHVLSSFNRPGLTFEQNAAIAHYAFPPGDVRSFLEARLFGAPLSSSIAMPQDLLDAFGSPVDRWQVLAVALPLMVLAAVATHLTLRHSLAGGAVDGPAAAVLRRLPWILPLGALVGGLVLPFPIAILLYWLTNNAWTLGQQWLHHRWADAGPPAAPVLVGPDPEPGPPAPRPGAGRSGSASARPRRHADGRRPRRRRRG
jgi:YidC/Oxa1 family membrane protein insertase